MTNGYKPFSWELFRSFPMIGIMRGFEGDAGIEIANRAIHAGLLNIEITMNTNGVLQQIEQLTSLGIEGVNIGVGTVTSIDQAEKALAAGASFLVSPIVNPDLIRFCSASKIPIFPGAYTPTEIWHAHECGAKIIKVFPVKNGGPSYFKSIKAPLDQIEMIAVDGVTIENVTEYLDAGACGIGVGGQLFNLPRMKAKDWTWQKERIQQFKKVFDSRSD